jgi:hypothetical protein
MKTSLLALLLGTLLATTALADELAVKVEHESNILGADGVTRITRFSERLIRRDNQSWVARIMPAGAHAEAEHQTGGNNHKHLDIAAASRWVARNDDGKLRVRLVDEHEKMVVDIPVVDYPNIGFDGKWSTAAQLLDPEQIKRMKPAARSAPAGARWYEGGTPQARVQVLWDEQEKYPRRIESANTAGTSRSSMIVTRETMPATLPWTTLKGYAQKEYSDLLD